MIEYEKEFNAIVNMHRNPFLQKKFRCGQFVEGLHESIKRYLTVVTSLQVINFYQLV